MKTLLDEFYETYKDTWFRKTESNKEQPMYYKIAKVTGYSLELTKYYPKTDRIYSDTTTMSMDHFHEFEIVEKDDPEIKKLNVVLAKSLLLH